MTVKVEVVARVSDPKKIELMKNKPKDFILRETKSGAAVYLSSENGIIYDVSPLLCNEQFRMNINEGRSSDGLVTIVCSIDGKPFRPFWMKGGKNQREVDKEVDARFSLRGSVCAITVNRLGLFLIQKFWIENKYEHVEVKTNELFSTVLKRNGGKFIFSENMFGTRSPLYCFKKAVMAAIKKANTPDGGGPLFFSEEHISEENISVIFHEEGSLMALTQGKKGAVFSAGMTMRSSSES
jgi:hypothetical protein